MSVVSVDAGSDAEKLGVRPGDAVLDVGGFAPTRGNLVQLLYLHRLLRPQRALHATLRRATGRRRTVTLPRGA